MDHVNRVSGIIVDAAIRVHSELGPGLLENAYEVCLAHELREAGLHVETQVEMPVYYKGIELEAGYRLDIVADKLVVVELKAVQNVADVHKAQILSYLKLSGLPLGLLLNFHVALMKDGIYRFANFPGGGTRS